MPRTPKLPQPSKWLVPIHLEKKYFKLLNEFVSIMIRITNEQLIPRLEEWEREADQMRPDSIKFDSDYLVLNALKDDSSLTFDQIDRQLNKERTDFESFKSVARLDQYADEIETTLNGMRLEYLQEVPISERTATAAGIAEDVNDFNNFQFHNVFKSVLGVDVFITEPWLDDAMRVFVKNNVGLITSISTDYFNQIEQITFRGVASGQRWEDIAKDIKGRYGVTRNRARLIGRDQVNKFNGQLTQLRQQSAGVTEYVWHTAGDTRVRSSHAALNGTTRKWKSSGIIPGEEIQCFPGDSELNMVQGCEKFYRRWYGGELTNIITASNETLRATPNHPILTQDGWKGIGSIDKGDYIFKITNKVLDVPKHDVNNRSAAIEQVFDFFSVPDLPLTRVTGSAAQFHGDGTDEKVDIIDMSRLLTDIIGAPVVKEFGELIFTIADHAAADSLLSGNSHSLLMFKSLFNTPNSFVRGLSKLLALVACHSGHAQNVCFASASNIDASIYKSCPDSSPGSSVFFGKGQDAQPGKIVANDSVIGKILSVWRSVAFADAGVNPPSSKELAKIIRVNFKNTRSSFQVGPFVYEPFRVVNKFGSEFSSHVYNLQTVNGWYTISNNFAAGNCRCWPEPVINEAVINRYNPGLAA